MDEAREGWGLGSGETGRDTSDVFGVKRAGHRAVC